MSRNFGKVWNCVSTVLVALVVLLAALLAGARLFGLQVFTILSGSMEPKYPVGSLIYVKSVDPSQVKEGDVITFLLSDTVTATHRVVGIVDQGDGARPPEQPAGRTGRLHSVPRLFCRLGAEPAGEPHRHRRGRVPAGAGVPARSAGRKQGEKENRCLRG